VLNEAAEGMPGLLSRMGDTGGYEGLVCPE